MPADLEAAQHVTDSTQLEQAEAGAHWSCPFCGGQERDLKGRCQNCGADRSSKDNSEAATVSEDSRNIAIASPEGIIALKRAANSAPSEELSPFEMAERQNTKRMLFILGCVGIVAILLGLGLWWLFAPRDVNAVISSTSWERVARLQERTTKIGTGWRSSMPSSAFGAACTSRFKETYDCNPYRCNAHQESYSCRPHSCNCSVSCTSQKNGYSKCSRRCSTCYSTCYRTVYSTCYHKCDRYEDWCLYSYYDWPTIKTLKNAGSEHPVWPTLEAKGKLQRIVRSESYSVGFTRDKDSWTYTPESNSEFARFHKHQRWRIRVNRAGSVKPLRNLSKR